MNLPLKYKTQWPTVLRTYKQLAKIKIKDGDIPRGVSLIAGKHGGNYSLHPEFKFVKSRKFGDIIGSLASQPNLLIIEMEVNWMVKNRSLATSPSLLCALEVYFSEELDEELLTKLTAKSVLLEVLKHKLKPIDGSRKVFMILEDLKLLVNALIPHSLGSVTQYMSDIRVHVLRKNYDAETIININDSGVFDQDEVDRKAVRDQQQKRRIQRATQQISISTTHFIAIGEFLASRSKTIIIDHETVRFRMHKMHQLIATVMIATGARLTEVVILSDFEPTLADAEIRSRVPEPNSFVTITPTAKRKDNSSTKSSDRVILFGLTQSEIGKMVKMIRKLAAAIQEGPDVWAMLNKHHQGHRAEAIRMIGDFSGFVTDAFYELNPHHRFIPRSLRGLYATLSFTQKAIKPMSEIVWINTLLDHALMSTSVHYNVYSLY